MGDGPETVTLEVRMVCALDGFDFGLLLDEDEATPAEFGHFVFLAQALDAEEFGGIEFPECAGAGEADAEVQHDVEVGSGLRFFNCDGHEAGGVELLVECLAEDACALVIPFAEVGEDGGADGDAVGLKDFGDDFLLGTGFEAGDDLFLAIVGEHAEWGIGAGFAIGGSAEFRVHSGEW